MKNAAFRLLTALALLLPGPGVYAQGSKTDLTGVWKYELDNGWEGMAIFSPTHFLWILTDKARPAFKDPAAPTIAEKARAFEAVNAAYGTWELESSQRGKNTFLFASDPNAKGKNISYDFEMEGDLFKYWVIQADGSRAPMGKCRKVADWNATSDCSMFNGVWKYVSANGIYIHAGSYGAWFIVDGAQADASTEEGKAKNFDVVDCQMAVLTRLDGNRYVWNIIHSSVERTERDCYFTGNEMQGNDVLTYWFVDAKGVQIGEKGQVKRIAR